MKLEHMTKRDVVVRFSRGQLKLYAQIYQNMLKQINRLEEELPYHGQSRLPLIAEDFIDTIKKWGI